MIIGVPKEIKKDENRVGLTPDAASELVAAGHAVIFEKEAGIGSRFADEDYCAAGAEKADTAAEVWAQADLIVKVKEPISGELNNSKGGQTLFTYLHLAGSEEVTRRVLDANITAIAYETVTDDNGDLPLLRPMSRIAGELAIQYGTNFLTAPFKGYGKLLSRNPGIEPVKVVVIGGGVVGLAAARRAAATGGSVTLLEKSNAKVEKLSENLPANIQVIRSNQANLKAAITGADLVVTAVLTAGAKAPILIRKADLDLMTPDGVVVDVSIDQGGCVEGGKVTFHSKPTIELGPIQYYGVSNMPGSVAHTATESLNAATFEHVWALANHGIREAIEANPHLAAGVNVWEGKLTNEAVAEAHKLRWIKLADAMAPATDYSSKYVGC